MFVFVYVSVRVCDIQKPALEKQKKKYTKHIQYTHTEQQRSNETVK